MRIFYPVFQWAKPTMQGVLKKVSDQTVAFRKQGIEIYTTVYGHHDPKVQRFEDIEYVNIHPKSRRYLIQLFEVRKRSVFLALERMKEVDPDITYTRYMGGGPYEISFVRNVSNVLP